MININVLDVGALIATDAISKIEEIEKELCKSTSKRNNVTNEYNRNTENMLIVLYEQSRKLCSY